MPKKTNLLEFMALACYYAQAHVDDPDVWSKDIDKREEYLQCTSYQMACFLCQNTKDGHNGVDWDIVLEELVSSKTDDNNRMLTSVEHWKNILSKKAKLFGGWK